MRKSATPGLDPNGKGSASARAQSDVRLRSGERIPTASGRDDRVDEVNLNEAWLVEHARHGDHQAFAVLVRRYERKLLRVLTRLIQDPEQARDLAQETFWRVYSTLDRFDTARRFGPWLFRVGVNLGLDWLRHSKGEPSPAISIDRTGRDGQLTLDLADPDPRTQAELAQEVRLYPGLRSCILWTAARTPPAAAGPMQRQNLATGQAQPCHGGGLLQR